MTFEEELKALMEKSCTTASELEASLHRLAVEEANKKIRETCGKHESLVGRYFKAKKQFIKVISSRASSEYYVTCLTFYKNPTYQFNLQAHLKEFPGDFYLGRFVLESINLKEVSVEEIEHLTEITEEEYSRAMAEHINKLHSMTFETKK